MTSKLLSSPSLFVSLSPSFSFSPFISVQHLSSINQILLRVLQETFLQIFGGLYDP